MSASRILSALGIFLIGISIATADIALQQVATGLPDVTNIVNAGDGSGRLFITLQGGKIVVYDGTQVLSTPFLDISSLVSCCGEQGLLGLAFHPDFKNNGYFFVDYTNQGGVGNTVVARFTAAKSSVSAPYFDTVVPFSEVILLTITQPYANHNGGNLNFGPDGYLYVSSGDGGSGGDPQDNGQNLKTLLGKILRLDVNAPAPYIPASNPFVGNPKAMPEIWAYGLRNPWKTSFDRQTGDFFIGDVGQNNWEEVDFQPAGSAGGQNYGWRKMEGRHCYNPSINCNDGTLTFPILEYDHNDGRCSITGGYRYRGTEAADLYGAYIYGDYCSGQIFAANQSCSGNWNSKEILKSGLSITAFGEDENGELYVANHPGGDGEIYKIVGSPSVEFSDDFEDNDVTDWMFTKGTWSGIAGNLIGTTSKKADAFPMLFGGCSQCTFETNAKLETAGAKFSVLAWYQDSKNYVELTFLESKNKVLFKEHTAGTVTLKKSASMPLNPGENHHITVSYNGFTYTVVVDSNLLFSLCPNSAPIGIGGFRVKGTASFQELLVY